MTIDTAALQSQLGAIWWEALNAIIVVIVALVGHRLALNWTGRAMRRARVDTGTQILVKRAMSAAFFTVTLLIVLGILGFNSTGLLTLAGAVGLAFSLAIQDILKNFFSGVYLLLERPFRVGDTIRVKDQQGVVENIGVRTTELRSPDNVQILVPNAVVFAEVVTNHTNAVVPAVTAPESDGQAGSGSADTAAAAAAEAQKKR
jgi:small conductance mechanosensitive channel